MARSEEDLRNLALIKWPQMIVTGVTVQPEQALNIILRTDTFFRSAYGGNNHEFNKLTSKRFRHPDKWDCFHDKSNVKGYYRQSSDAESEYQQILGCIYLDYVHNDWASCAFIGGPHGFMNPDGKVAYLDNIGKWPDVGDVYKDWQFIAHAFPYLDIGVTLMSQERSSDIPGEPVVSFALKNGKVCIVDPKEVDVHESHQQSNPRSEISWGNAFGSLSREQGLSNQQLDAMIRELTVTGKMHLIDKLEAKYSVIMSGHELDITAESESA